MGGGVISSDGKGGAYLRRCSKGRKEGIGKRGKNEKKRKRKKKGKRGGS